MIPIYKPYLPSYSLIYAHEALDSTWISSQGKYIDLVQDKLKETFDIKYVLPVNNGTSACHLLAKAISFRYKKNQIIVPNNVFVAAWNGFLFDKEFELITVDSDLETFNFDLNKLDLTIKQYPDAAVLIVHNIGSIINVPFLKRKYKETVFIEDNCEGLLGKYENKFSGTESLCSATSFFGNKNLTSGEGGAFLTNDEEIFQHAKCLFGQGQKDKKFIHYELGYNYRMTNIQAAILYGQLSIMNEIQEKKEKVFETYRNAFKNRTDVFCQRNENETQHSN